MRDVATVADGDAALPYRADNNCLSVSRATFNIGRPCRPIWCSDYPDTGRSPMPAAELAVATRLSMADLFPRHELQARCECGGLGGAYQLPGSRTLLFPEHLLDALKVPREQLRRALFFISRMAARRPLVSAPSFGATIFADVLESWIG
jgi:hypothetical protein